jgi:hypothetical protein
MNVPGWVKVAACVVFATSAAVAGGESASGPPPQPTGVCVVLQAPPAGQVS